MKHSRFSHFESPSAPPAAPFVNVATHLPRMAQQEPDRLAVVCPMGRGRQGRPSYAHWTFRQLNDASDRLAHRLHAIGIRRGVRTVLMVGPSLQFFALTFALFKIGAVLVLVDPGMGIRNLRKCLSDADPEAFIGVPRAHLARLLFGWARRSLRVLVTVGRPRLWAGHHIVDVGMVDGGKRGRAGAQRDVGYPVAPPGADEVAAIIFTSGSTGPPKGAVYTHGILAAQVEVLRHTYGMQSGEIDLCTFPPFALFAPALGMTSVIPEMDATRPARVEPRNIIEPIRRFSVTNMFASPALLRRVVSDDDSNHQSLPSLRRVISAGAPVPADVLERFARLLAPQAQVFTPYGATEALPVTSIGSDEILSETKQRTVEGAGICVGRPVDGMRLAIIRISDDPIPVWSEDLLLPQGEIGEIIVQGPVVTRAYSNRPDATAMAKIPDPPCKNVWHRMSDLGYLDGCGRLWFCGRKSHRVITTDGTLHTIPCEAVFNTHPMVSRTALVGVGQVGTQQPVLCVELRQRASRSKKNTLRLDLAALAISRPHTRSIKTFLFHSDFPVDIRHNAKISRETLARWAAQRLR